MAITIVNLAKSGISKRTPTYRELLNKNYCIVSDEKNNNKREKFWGRCQFPTTSLMLRILISEFTYRNIMILKQTYYGKTSREFQFHFLIQNTIIPVKRNYVERKVWGIGFDNLESWLSEHSEFWNRENPKWINWH